MQHHADVQRWRGRTAHQGNCNAPFATAHTSENLAHVGVPYARRYRQELAREFTLFNCFGR